MYNIVFCDDNAGFLSLFRSFAKKHFRQIMPDEAEYEIGPCFGNGKEVLEYIKGHKVDVLFLDIDMPEMTGFELAKILCRDFKDTLVVFMSAYDNFVYESFNYLPFAYMRKAHIADDLPNVVLRIKNKLLEPSRYVTLSTKDKEIRVDAKEIMFFESDKNYYTTHMASGRKYSCRGTISNLEEAVKDLNFFRTHSAYLVNLEYAEKITDDGYLLVGNVTIPISQKRLKDFKKAFSEYARRSMGI